MYALGNKIVVGVVSMYLNKFNSGGRDLNRIIMSVITVAMLVFGLSTANASTTLMTIGVSPFYQPPLTTVETLRAMVLEKGQDVKKGFEKAGRPELYAPFVAQIETTQIERLDFQKGSWFEWMFFKKNGKGVVRVAKDVTWANETTFPGFKFDIDYKGSRYTFAVPLGCGNIALMGMSAVPAKAKVVSPVVANLAPRCGMKVSPVRAFCGEVITVDASSSTDNDGTIEEMKIVFVDDMGKVVREEVINDTLVADVAMPYGASSLTVTLTDNDGETSAQEECTVAVAGVSRVRFLADVGYYRQFDPANYLFGRIGLEYKFNEQFALLALIGGAPQVEGHDGASAFIIDLLAEYSFGSRYFVDLGVGGWITDADDDLEAENSQLDLVAGFGARIYGEPEDFNASLFVEVRSAFDELDGLYDYGRFGAGVRFRF